MNGIFIYLKKKEGFIGDDVNGKRSSERNAAIKIT